MTDTILCVDDDANLLEGLKRQLRKQFTLEMSLSGEAGLVVVKEDGPFAVVVSDMRMPGMNGARFLAQVRAMAPDTVRILLTGQTDIQDAIVAVNEGHIFRFITKPCTPELLDTAFQAAEGPVRSQELDLIRIVLERRADHVTFELLMPVTASREGGAERIKAW